MRALFEASEGVNPVVISATAAKLAAGAWTDTDIMEHSGSVEGALWILTQALKLAGNAKPEEIVATVPHGLLIDKAAVVMQLSGLVHWNLAANRDAEGGSDSDENPQTA